MNLYDEYTLIADCCGHEVKLYDVHDGFTRCPECKEMSEVTIIDEFDNEHKLSEGELK